jgi:hypothetical protein
LFELFEIFLGGYAMNKKTFMVLVAALLVFSGVALANTAQIAFDKGLAAYKKGDYSTALLEFRSAAEQGHLDAMYNLGFMYEKGRGTPQNFPEAVTWYRKAAEQGEPWSQVNLGLMYEEGRGVSQNYPEAVKWYRKAAEQGDSDAQSNLGFMYQNGWGTTQDYAEAVTWYRKAAEQGHSKGQLRFGLMNEKGMGTLQNFQEAYIWFSLAAGNSDGELQKEAISARDRVAKLLTAEQLKQAQQIVKEWKPK